MTAKKQTKRERERLGDDFSLTGNKREEEERESER